MPGGKKKNTAYLLYNEDYISEQLSKRANFFTCLNTQLTNLKMKNVIIANANVFKYVLVVSLLFMWIIKVYNIKNISKCFFIA